MATTFTMISRILWRYRIVGPTHMEPPRSHGTFDTWWWKVFVQQRCMKVRKGGRHDFLKGPSSIYDRDLMWIRSIVCIVFIDERWKDDNQHKGHEIMWVPITSDGWYLCRGDLRPEATSCYLRFLSAMLSWGTWKVKQSKSGIRNWNC